MDDTQHVLDPVIVVVQRLIAYDGGRGNDFGSPLLGKARTGSPPMHLSFSYLIAALTDSCQLFLTKESAHVRR